MNESKSWLIFPLPLDAFLKVIKRAHQTPVEKFEHPQTEAQEIGWMTKPLVGIKDDLSLDALQCLNLFWNYRVSQKNYTCHNTASTATILKIPVGLDR